MHSQGHPSAAWLQASGTAGHLPLPLANAMVSEREDPVAGHPRYQKVKDLNEGTFGFVQLGFDKRTNAQVGLRLSCSVEEPKGRPVGHSLPGNSSWSVLSATQARIRCVIACDWGQ